MEELGKVLVAVCHVTNIVGKALEDGKVNVGDLPLVFTLFQELSSVAGVDLKAAMEKAKSLSPSEVAELSAMFKAEFDLPDDKVEGMVELGVDLLVAILSAYLSWKKASA
jgi:hypothetical protein